MSITTLQLKPVLKPFRICEIKRRTTDGYETDWQDVSNLVNDWPNIQFSLDTIRPFSYRRGNAEMSFRNDDKQFAPETFTESKFSGFLTRYRTLCRLRTGLKDDSNVQFPTTTADQVVFSGVFSDDIDDNLTETRIVINDVTNVLQEFPASNIAPSVVGVALTSKEILQTIRDYQDGFGNVILDPFISSGAWLLTNTTHTYTIPTTTSLDGKSALDLIEELALAENHIFYLDGAGNVNFLERTPNTTSQYSFNGPGSKNVNIVSLNSFNEGVSSIYTKFSLALQTNTVVSTEQAFTVGDASSSWKYGQREFSFRNAFVNTTTAGSICSGLLTDHVSPKKRLDLNTKYITQLNIKDKVTVTYKGFAGGDGSLWGHFLWDVGLWSDEKGGITINSVTFHIIGIGIDMDKSGLESNFQLKEV